MATTERFRYFAVLTGDIIGSSHLRSTQLSSVRALLITTANTVRDWKRGLVKGELEFFRGDGWQLLLTDPSMALRVAIILRASLLAQGLSDTRVAVGLGSIDETTSEGKVSLSMGQAFALSGQSLDKMTQYFRMTIEIPKSVGVLCDWLPIVGHLCDSLIRQWTERQAEIVRIAINPSEPDYEKIGRTLKPSISKQAVAKALAGANWHAIREAIHTYEGTPWETVLRMHTSVNQ